MKEESKEELRSSLDELLGYDLPDEVPGLDEDYKLKPVKKESTQPDANKAANKAKRVMDNLLKFYLSEEIIEEQEYIKAKAELDKSALSALIKQMENSERAITILMRAIDDEGDVSPRMFEVLSDLQRTMLDIIKSQTMYMVAVEENVKKIARDLDVYQNGGSTKKIESSGGIKSRGTKDLMRALQDSIKEENIQDVDGIEDEE